MSVVKPIRKDKPRYGVVDTFERQFKASFAKHLGQGLKEVVEKMAEYTK